MEYMNQYRQLQQFINVEEFDRERSKVFYGIKDKLSKGALSVWNVLSQHALKVPGVCWIQIDTIANASGVSRSTVERAIRLFKKLSVIKVVETTRPKRGGYGANVYVFLKLGEGSQMKGRENAEKPYPSTNESHNSEKEANISSNLKINNNHLNVKRLPYIKFVPQSLQHFQAYFGKQVKELYGRIWLAAKTLKLAVNKEIMQQIGFIAMNQLKEYVKAGKQFTEEELCKIAYKIGLNQLEQRFAPENKSECESNREVKPSIHRKVIRTEMVPDWLHKEEVPAKPKEEINVPTISEERKKAIWEQVEKLSESNNGAVTAIIE